MSNIDAIIARSREEGAFAERKRFTVAREHAIRKMREFALADPHFFILQLTQAAVANRASYINVEATEDHFALSYVGGHYREEELSRIFDFLFASKDNVDVGHLRELALGINALLLFEPDSIIIETGDGTVKGSTRLQIHGGEDAVDVGTPDAAIKGTLIKAIGMRRRKMRKRSALGLTGNGPREVTALEERCLTAPVPVIVNGHALFGYTSSRFARPIAHHSLVTFDEGDLFGTLGVRAAMGPPTVRILTFGVWIQSFEKELVPGVRVGGIVNFDRLRKTADHSGIVQDEILEEMWARLRPYARQVAAGGGKGTVTGVHPLDGAPLAPAEIRPWLRAQHMVVLCPAETITDDEARTRARRIGASLDAEVVVAPAQEVRTLRTLAGDDVSVVAPNLSVDESSFYGQPVLAPPARPWLASPVDLDPIAPDELLDGLDDRAGKVRGGIRWWASRWSATQRIRARIFAPEDAAHDGLRTEVTTTGRLVSVDHSPWPFPGQVLRIDFPDLPPSALATANGRPGDALTAAMQWIKSRATAAGAESNRRVLASLAGLDGAPTAGAARAASAALAERAIVRLRRTSEGAVRVVAELTRPLERVDLMSLPIFRTLDGRQIGFAEVVANLDVDGLVYGTVPEIQADLRGLDRSRILELTLPLERELITIVGDSAYVRIDGRDVLASTGGFEVRDLAVGLRRYPEHPLLLEGPSAAAGALPSLDEEAELVSGLLERFFAESIDGNPHVDEQRMQACRHLQHYVLTYERSERATSLARGIRLFLDDREVPRTVGEVAQTVRREEGAIVHFGHAFAGAQLAWLAQVARNPADLGDVETPKGLVIDPFLARRLEHLGTLQPAFDFPLAADDAEESFETTRLLHSEEISDDGFTGVIGLARADEAGPRAVAVLEEGRRRAHLFAESATEFGVVGLLRYSGEWDAEAQRRAEWVVREAARSTLQRVATSLHRVQDEADRGARVAALLRYASRELVITAQPDGSWIPKVRTPLAARILNLPVFPSTRGIPVSAMQLCSEFCAYGDNPDEHGGAVRTQLDDNTPDALRQWVRDTLHRGRLVRPASDSADWPAVKDAPLVSTSERELLSATERWLERLRPDLESPGAPDTVKVHAATPQHFVDPRTWGDATSNDRGDRGAPMVGGFRVSAAAAIGVSDPGRDVADLSVWYDNELVRFVPDTSLIVFNRDHEVFRRVAGRPASAASLAWLLLTAYAELNRALEPVTNDHELRFQRSVAARLASGTLVG